MSIPSFKVTSRFLQSVLSAGLLLLATCPANADKWSFELTPYLLAVMIDGDAGIGRVQGVDVDVSTGDIIDNLDLGLMVHFEGHHENGWGFAFDYAFMKLSDDLSGPRGGVVDAEVTQGVLEAMLIKSAHSTNEGFGYFAGLRWWSNEVDVELDPVLLPGTVTRSVDEDWVDVFVGARWRNPINDRWTFSFRGDVGAGGADLTWQVWTAFRYRFENSNALDLGYRAMAVDYETGTPGDPSYFMYDTVTHGPFIGYTFRF